jgi:hypothetical protein
MNRKWHLPAKILTGICTLALSSFSQTYTVSAKPGALNYIQGAVSLNGDPVWRANLKTTFLNANDVLLVEDGKAEVLLTPGVFLRVGDHSQVRMIKPSLVETQLEVVSGESMIEVEDFVPGSSVAVMDHGSVTTLTKAGLFRFTDHNIAALDGKADVAFGDRKLVLNKNREVPIDDTLKVAKVDLNQPDELYAWSNTRAQYNAAASYAGSTAAYNSGGYGFSSYNSPGWYWASGFNSYMWLPSNGAFYSPFGWGFYGPGLVAYAPVMGVPYYGGYGYGAGYYPVAVTGKPVKAPTTTAAQLTVPVNPAKVGVASFTGASPAALNSARIQMQNYTNFYGLRTASGSTPAMLRNGTSFSSMQAASHAAASSAREASAARSSGGGGWSGSSGGFASAAPATASLGGSSSGMSSMSRGSSGGSGGHAK